MVDGREPFPQRRERGEAGGEVRARRERAPGLREDAGVAGVQVEHLGVRRIRVVTLEQPDVVGGGTDDRDLGVGCERQRAVVLEQHDRLLRGFASECRVFGATVRVRHRVFIDVRTLEQSQ